MESRSQREVAQLVGARMPADHGLSSLGLVMQLFGSIFLGFMALLAVVPIFSEGHPGAWVIFVVGATGAVRSAFHRMAGSALIYGSQRGPFHPTRVYVVLAAAQTVLTVLLVNKDRMLPASGNVALIAVLLAWPLTLLLVLSSARMKRLAQDLPPSEDMGFEGAAVLMALLGAIGTAFGALNLFAIFHVPSDALTSMYGILAVLMLGTLLVRSILHVRAGLRGTSGIDSDGASDSAARYYTFGVVSSVIVGAVLLMQLMMTRMHPAGILSVGIAVYLLLVWPLAIRRFFTERNFSALLAGSESPNYRRAPDAGLTALGWVLLATGVFSLAWTLPAALFHTDGGIVDIIATLTLEGDGASGRAMHSHWWLVGVAVAQLWAAFELIGMTDRYRLAATAYGAIATLVTLYTSWSTLQGLGSLGAAGGPLEALRVFMPLAWSLVIPAATVVLANRNIRPLAQARVRSA